MTITYNDFSQADDEELRQVLNVGLSPTDAQKALKRLCLKLGRPFYITTQRAFQLGLINYSEHDHLLLSHRRDGWRSDEVDVLINNPNISRKRLAKALNRSTQSVNKKFVEFSLKNEGPTQPWETSEEELLIKIIGNTPLKTICRQLMRTAIDVKYTAIKLGLAKEGVFKQFTGRIPKPLDVNTPLVKKIACS